MTATPKKARAIVHGAVSIVNAIATGRGSALGISLKVTAEAQIQTGHGIKFTAGRNGDRLIKNIIQKTIPKEIIDGNMISISVDSQIPLGYGLKSSSAVSNAVALACSRMAKEAEIDDYGILDVSTRSSLEAKVSMTGAYDDATACYFGGFTVTDNYSRRLIRNEKAPENLYAIIMLPTNSSRGDIHKLRNFSDLFIDAFELAESGRYWKAMKLNGVLASAALSSSYAPVLDAIEQGALSASISGNGPSIVAVGYQDTVEQIVEALSKFGGRIIVSRVNNEKAVVNIVND
ncbi:MAG: shikimate kinase [Thermoproteota archaeon]|nr:shikimate kinase [Thermoproteota archaeon]